MKITVKTSTCDIILEVEPSSTVENVKDNIQVKTGIHRRFQKLSFSNKELEDGCILSDYQIENSSSVDFQLIVPSFDEVLDAMTTLKTHTDSHTSCTNEITGSSLEVTEAMTTLKAFIDSHSCCAIAITEILNKRELTADRTSKIKIFCENLLRENSVLINARDEQHCETKALQVKVHNMETELVNTKAELANTKAELGNTKAELANQKVYNERIENELANLKVVNQTLFEKVEVVSTFSSTMEQRINELTAAFSNIRAKEINGV